MKKKYFLAAFLSLLSIFSIFYFSTKSQNSQPIQLSHGATTTPFSLGQRTKSTGCIPKGVNPDSGCTPGAIFEDVTKEKVCTSGYSKSVRDVPESVKKQVYLEYGITSHQPYEYEVDHFISLELGGSNDIANLWPEPANPTPGYHEKDKVENYLHKILCSGEINLSEAQQMISSDWLKTYESIK
jgi:hypothetical protein